jgi:predicted transcriptional regulator of viral defense system
MKTHRIGKAKRIFDEYGPIVKASVLRENKLCSREIAELIAAGCLSKIKTGYYAWSADVTDIHDLEIAATVIRNGVICLFTAAQYYSLTTVNSTAIDVAIPLAGKRPILPDYPPIRLHRVSKNVFNIGITSVKISEAMIKIYDKERTVCDFFRMRYQLGDDVALEVLKNYMSGSGKNIQKLFEYAAKLRIKSVISPYVEALL